MPKADTKINASAGIQLPSITSAGGLGTDSSGNITAVTVPYVASHVVVRIYEASGIYPLRSTATSSSTQPVEWVGPDAPTIGSGYANNDVDTWVASSV